MSVKSLAEAVARAVQRRINAETRVMRGMIQAGRFISGSRSYPMAQAVDCDTGAKELYYSRFSRLDDNGAEISSPNIEQSYAVSAKIPIQDGYYFTVNSAQLYWTAKYLMNDKQNAVLTNITMHDIDGGALWTGNVIAGTYLTICKNKKI